MKFVGIYPVTLTEWLVLMMQERPKSLKKWRKSILGLGVIVAISSIPALEAGQTERRQAKRMHDRLAGTAPSADPTRTRGSQPGRPAFLPVRRR